MNESLKLTVTPACSDKEMQALSDKLKAYNVSQIGESLAERILFTYIAKMMSWSQGYTSRTSKCEFLTSIFA